MPKPPQSGKAYLLYSYRKAAEKFGIQEKWDKTPKAKKFALKAKRASLTDYDRFVVSNLKRRRAFALRRKTK